MAEEISVKDFESAILILKNIREGNENGRFQFTATENATLDFTIRVMKANFEELTDENLKH